MPNATFTLSAVGATPPLRVGPEMTTSQYLPFSMMCLISAGGALTYSVEVTGDNVDAPGYNPATGTWFPFTNMAGLTASANAVLQSNITAIRARISAYTSGSLTTQFVWRTAVS